MPAGRCRCQQADPGGACCLAARHAQCPCSSAAAAAGHSARAAAPRRASFSASPHHPSLTPPTLRPRSRSTSCPSPRPGRSRCFFQWRFISHFFVSPLISEHPVRAVPHQGRPAHQARGCAGARGRRRRRRRRRRVSRQAAGPEPEAANNAAPCGLAGAECSSAARRSPCLVCTRVWSRASVTACGTSAALWQHLPHVGRLGRWADAGRSGWCI